MNLSITNIRERIFNDTKHEKAVARNSNPFAQGTFKGNVLTADVFEASSSKSSTPSFGSITSAPAKSKLYLSAMAGSVNNIGAKISEKFSAGVESIVAFSSRVTEGVSNFWNKMKNTEVKIGIIDDIKNSMTSGVNRKEISKMDLGNEEAYAGLHEMFSSKVSALAEASAAA
ncbi:MAG: hypothetical protein R3Y28_03670 [Candidatus Gastranaerophilales bacterium]